MSTTEQHDRTLHWVMLGGWFRETNTEGDVELQGRSSIAWERSQNIVGFAPRLQGWRRAGCFILAWLHRETGIGVLLVHPAPHVLGSFHICMPSAFACSTSVVRCHSRPYHCRTIS